jgi:hypothetical protein
MPMSPRLPPRREPRVLAVSRSPTGLRFAVADPWELRVANAIDCREASLGPALLRIARREKPTLLVVGDGPHDAALQRAAARVALWARISILTQALPALPLVIAQDMYPELPLRAPSPELARIAALAMSAVLYAECPVPSRHYAPRHSPRCHRPHGRAA